jgi:hypothetical protein
MGAAKKTYRSERLRFHGQRTWEGGAVRYL